MKCIQRPTVKQLGAAETREELEHRTCPRKPEGHWKLDPSENTLNFVLDGFTVYEIRIGEEILTQLH